MSDHFNEELFALVSGELDREETARVAAHLRDCRECTSEFISVAVAYGSLRAARRAEDALVNGPSIPGPHAPAVQPPLRFRPRRTPRRLYGALAAAVLVVVAVGIGLLVGASSTSPVYAVATLHHRDAPESARGRVTVLTSNRVKEMDVVTTGLPPAPDNHYYEVWLLQPSTNKMMPVGLLPPSGEGTFSVAGAIMAQYSAVDISLQTNDGNPVHSKFSVLRGTVVPIVS